MDIGLISLIILVAVVIIGFARKVNVGVLAIASAAALAYRHTAHGTVLRAAS